MECTSKKEVLKLFESTLSFLLFFTIYILVLQNQNLNRERIFFLLSSVGLAIHIGIILDAFLFLTEITFQYSLIPLSLIILGLLCGLLFTNLKEKNRAKQLTLISMLSNSFANNSDIDININLNQVLKLIGINFKVEDVALYFLSNDGNKIRQKFKWNKDEYYQKENTEELVDSIFPWWMENSLRTEKPCYFKEKDFPPVGKIERELTGIGKCKSLFVLPLQSKAQILGFLTLQSSTQSKKYSRDDKEILQIVKNFLTPALLKIEYEEEILRKSLYDSLTELPNHALFIDRLEKELMWAKRANKMVGVAFIDLDMFKVVNDSIGHEGGNEVLKIVAKRLKFCAREHDTVARFGGDEFLIMLTNINYIEDLEKIAEKIVHSFTTPVVFRDYEFNVTASVGISVYPTDGLDANILIQMADTAMYAAKTSGKNSFMLCSNTLKKEVAKKTLMRKKHNSALEKNELKIYFQPQINSLTREIIGVEALLRWFNPELGIISPVDFIPLAEQTGQINEIGEWVIRNACKQIASWNKNRKNPISVAINLSRMQLQSSNFPRVVDKIIFDTGIDPRNLDFEIRESLTDKHSKTVLNTLNELKELGGNISLDDFRLENFSVQNIKGLPLDKVKLNMQFLLNKAVTDKDDLIAKAIIELVKSLEIKVLAERVEHIAQNEFLIKNTCDELQGYYFYKPMAAESFEEILLSNRAERTVEKLDTKLISVTSFST